MSPDPLIDTLFRGATPSAASPPASARSAGSAGSAGPAALTDGPLAGPSPSAPSASAAPTAPTASAAPSAPPVRTAGTRTRAGNAMDRTRIALLDGARAAVTHSGTKITMAQVAAASGVAKGTLYNHFRTREDVLAALVVDEVRRIAGSAHGRPLPEALGIAAIAVSTSPLLKALARHDPGALATLACIDPATDGWRVARTEVVALLDGDGRAGADTVLRLLASYIPSPATPAAIAADVAVVVGGLPQRADRTNENLDPDPPPGARKQAQFA